MSEIKANNSFSLFIDSIKGSIDSKRIILNDRAIEDYHINTESLRKIIPLALKPINNLEIVNIVKLANQYKIKLFPISKGNNWGYGSSLPIEDNSVILDLSLMNKIIEINEKHGYAIIEPGVTQFMLFKELKKINSNYHFDPTGAGPNTSILGNILERGFGLGLYGDHFKSLINFEVVLANGKIIRTGFWNKDNKNTAHCFPNAIGPNVSGLFTQANFGIVTKVSFFLTPKAESIKLGIINCYDNKSMAENSAKLKKLFINGALTAGFNVASSTRILATINQYPYKQTKNVTPLAKNLKKELEKQYKLFPWSILIPIRGTKAQAKAQEKDLKRIFGSKIKVVNENKINILKFIFSSKLMPTKFIATINKTKSLFEFLNGEPKDMTLASPYWRNRKKPPKKNRHPAKDNCGLIWLGPTIELDERRIEEFVNITTKVMHDFKLDDAISLLYANERTLIATIPILYDKESKSETKNAHECYEVLSKIYERNGFYAYRKSIHAMENLYSKEYKDFLNSIKNCVDQNKIIAPGRYE